MRYGFNGESNDAHDLREFTPDEWMCSAVRLFDDGKVMMGKHQSLKEVTWDNIQARFGVDRFREREILLVAQARRLRAGRAEKGPVGDHRAGLLQLVVTAHRLHEHRDHLDRRRRAVVVLRRRRRLGVEDELTRAELLEELVDGVLALEVQVLAAPDPPLAEPDLAAAAAPLVAQREDAGEPGVGEALEEVREAEQLQVAGEPRR